MNTDPSFDKNLDLEISRIIHAPRAVVWKAWTEPEHFEKWWVPAPEQARVVAMELRPGGAFLTERVTQSGDIVPHMNGCFLDLEAERASYLPHSLSPGGDLLSGPRLR